MKKILVIGQTPPPYHGQAIMIERLVKAQFDDVEIYHIRMNFSKSVQSVGKFQVWKIFQLFSIVYQAIIFKFKYRVTTLYYPPAGPNFTPILRDLIILSLIRPFFKYTIFHFRAAGISEYLDQSNILLRKLAKFIYNTPDIAIQLSSLNPADGKYFQSKKVVIIKNGLEDAAKAYLPIQRTTNNTSQILFVGIIKESKGVRILLKAAKVLKENDIKFHINFIGDFASSEFQEEISSFCTTHQLHDMVSFQGVKTGKEKWDFYASSDIFCFPSFFESESFGNVVVEAMMFELPVIATRWRGIADIVKDGKTGFLIPIQNSEILAKKIKILIDNFELGQEMGKTGREVFLSNYLLDKHLLAMENMFLNLYRR